MKRNINKIFSIIILATFATVAPITASAINEEENINPKLVSIQENNGIKQYEFIEQGKTINIKVDNGKVYQSVDGDDFTLIGSFQINEVSNFCDSTIETRATGWSSVTERYTQFSFNREERTIAGISVILNLGLVYHGGYPFIVDLANSINDFITEMNVDITVYGTENFQTWSSCSIYIKSGNVKLYSDSSRLSKYKIDENSGTIEWFAGDPNAYTAPVGCRYL